MLDISVQYSILNYNLREHILDKHSFTVDVLERFVLLEPNPIQASSSVALIESIIKIEDQKLYCFLLKEVKHHQRNVILWRVLL